ncbi:MAG: GNAT family N-acetyltransferase [Lutibacter sp.]|uniref:GNAT family N-acetyltransferase n=1 Tax=Lutibacter sp. TaxID=1925666 RepID=UPI0017A544DC|nr:GNAT family N-acetyltransferase [Lutibacter sp.]MBT8317972.1 GNAT family N-acetyltransferase [Lutibacter sp.]NNJ58831.1 GNAT family N-acetyltransferase [Lutibacter sp.]
MIEIKKVRPQDTYGIRKEILRKNIPLPFEFNGDFDESTFHLGAFKDEKLIAISSFMKAANTNLEGSQYQLRGMATLEAYQGYGAGKLMIQQALLLLNELEIDCVWCNARVTAVNFYKKQGFKIFGDSFMAEFIGEHYVMFKYLTK